MNKMTLEQILTDVAKGTLSVEEGTRRIRQLFARPRSAGDGGPSGRGGPPLILALIFAAVGVACACLSAGFAIASYHFASTAAHVEGTVTRMQVTSNRGSSAPVVRYEVDGKSYEFQSSVSSNPPAHVVGDKVTVMYHPERPGDGRIASFLEMWFMPMLLGFFGIVFGAIGGGLMLARLRRRVAC
jgi:hypothetical protein